MDRSRRADSCGRGAATVVAPTGTGGHVCWSLVPECSNFVEVQIHNMFALEHLTSVPAIYSAMCQVRLFGNRLSK